SGRDLGRLLDRRRYPTERPTLRLILLTPKSHCAGAKFVQFPPGGQWLPGVLVFFNYWRSPWRIARHRSVLPVWPVHVDSGPTLACEDHRQTLVHSPGDFSLSTSVELRDGLTPCRIWRIIILCLKFARPSQ